jgi:hypothetical protein
VHVVAAHHGAQQFGGLGLGDQPDLQVAVRDRGQEAGLDLRGIVHARRHAVRQQVEQEGLGLAGRRRLDQFDQLGDLLARTAAAAGCRGRAFGACWR